MDNKNIFANNLKRYMEENHKTRREVCEALGFNYYTFTDWVNGKKYPRMDKVEILAKYFGCLKSDLIEEKKEPAEEGELSKNKKAILSLVENCPEEKAGKLLQILRLYLEDEV